METESKLKDQRKVITGNAAAAYAAMLCRPDVIAAYPITPSTEILEVLYRLGAKKAINAQVRWEEPSVEDILGPLTPMGRPESEL